MRQFQNLIAEAVDDARAELIVFLQKMVQIASLPDHEHEIQNLITQWCGGERAR